MVRIELTEEIARPAEKVYAALTDLDCLPEWQSSAVPSKPDAPLAVGTRIREQRSMMK